MLITKHSSIGLPWVVLHPGDFYASREQILISTVLGSCVSVVLYDTIHAVSGMNHYMLPHNEKELGEGDREKPNHEKFGDRAIQRLLHTMENLGAEKRHVKAKIFGGARLLTSENSVNPRIDILDQIPRVGDVALKNIELARSKLSQLSIPIENSDTGGNEGRRIYLITPQNRVKLSRLRRSTEIAIARFETAVFTGEVTNLPLGQTTPYTP